MADDDGLPNPFLAQLQLAAAKKAAKAGKAAAEADATRAAKDAQANAADGGGGGGGGAAPAPAPAASGGYYADPSSSAQSYGAPPPPQQQAVSHPPMPPPPPSTTYAPPPPPPPPPGAGINSGGSIESPGQTPLSPMSTPPRPPRFPTQAEPLVYSGPDSTRQLRELAEDTNHDNKPMILDTLRNWLQNPASCTEVLQQENTFGAMAAVATCPIQQHANAGCALLSSLCQNHAMMQTIIQANVALGPVSSLISSGNPLAIETGAMFMAELCETDLYTDREAARIGAEVGTVAPMVVDPRTMSYSGADGRMVDPNSIHLGGMVAAHLPPVTVQPSPTQPPPPQAHQPSLYPQPTQPVAAPVAPAVAAAPPLPPAPLPPPATTPGGTQIPPPPTATTTEASGAQQISSIPKAAPAEKTPGCKCAVM